MIAVRAIAVIFTFYAPAIFSGGCPGYDAMPGHCERTHRFLFPVRHPVIRKVEIRGWTGYTGETFTGNGQEELVYKTPGGEVYHKSRDCTYLKLSVHMVSAAELPNCRNESGGKYDPCEYCVRKESPGRMVYIADYGVSYHNSRNCQGLKRTVMAVPLSHTEGLRCCSRCGS